MATVNAEIPTKFAGSRGADTEIDLDAAEWRTRSKYFALKGLKTKRRGFHNQNRDRALRRSAASQGAQKERFPSA